MNRSERLATVPHEARAEFFIANCLAFVSFLLLSSSLTCHVCVLTRAQQTILNEAFAAYKNTMVLSLSGSTVPGLFFRVSLRHQHFIEPLSKMLMAGFLFGARLPMTSANAATMMEHGICFLHRIGEREFEYTLGEPWVLEAGQPWLAHVSRRCPEILDSLFGSSTKSAATATKP